MNRTPLKRRTALRKRARKPKRGVVLDNRYLAWIHQRSCLVCGDPQVEAHHEGRPRNDHRGLPLCPFHHREGVTARHTIGRRKFERIFDISLEDEIRWLRAAYLAGTGKEAV